MSSYVIPIALVVLIVALGFYLPKVIDRQAAQARQRELSRARQRATPAGVAPPVVTPRPTPPPRSAAPSPSDHQPASPRSVAPSPPVQVSAAPPQRRAAPIALDPSDPLAARYGEVTALLQSTLAHIDTLPETLNDRAAMRAMALVAELSLQELRPGLATTNPGARAALSTRMDKLYRQAISLRGHAQGLAGSYAAFGEIRATLQSRAAVLQRNLDAQVQQASYPLAMSYSGPVSIAAIGLAQRLPQPSEVRTYEDVKRQLSRARGLFSDIESGQRALDEATRQRRRLLELLASPALAEQPEWHHAIGILIQRERALGAPPAGDGAGLAALRAEADVLLARRHALFANLAPSDDGSCRLDEQQLPRLTEEAEAITSAVRDLSRRARAAVVLLRRVSA